MRLFIVENHSCVVNPDKSETIPVKLPGVGCGDSGVLALSPNFNGQGENGIVQQLFQNFKRAFRYFQINTYTYNNYNYKDWVSLITFESTTGAEKERQWNIQLNSGLLNELYVFLTLFDKTAQLDLKLVMKCHHYSFTHGRMVSSVLFEGKDFVRNSDNVNIYEKGQIPQLFDPPTSSDDKKRKNNLVSFSFSLEVNADSILPLCINNFLFPSKPSEGNRKVYEERRFCDFEILTDGADGKMVSNRCHKIFLYGKGCSTQSAVFRRMLEGEFDEAKKSSVTLKDISPEGVTALLKFLYYSDIKDAVTHPHVAHELLRAADKYDIPNLWRAMLTVFVVKPIEWFNCDVALNLYSFVRDCLRDTELAPLKDKVIKVLAANRKMLFGSPLLAEILETETAMDRYTLVITPKE